MPHIWLHCDVFLKHAALEIIIMVLTQVLVFTMISNTGSIAKVEKLFLFGGLSFILGIL